MHTLHEMNGRVAPVGRPTGALTGSGLGDFHHPALPWLRLAAFRYPLKSRRHGDPSRCLAHVSLQKFVDHTGCLCSVGSAAPPRYPTSTLVCSPPTPLRHGPGLWFPSPSAYHPPYAFLHRPGVRTETPGASDAYGAGRPLPRVTDGPTGASQVTGPSLHTCRGLLPRLGRYHLALLRWHPLPPSASLTASASRDQLPFGADFARPTCSPAYASTGVLPP